MIRRLSWSAGALAFLIGASAAAQTAVAPADPPFALVAEADRLTFPAVFADADIVMKLVMAGLAISALAAAAIWVAQATRLRPASLPGALAYLSGLGSAGPLIGFFGACYTLMASCIGMANVRPAPSLSILAPGFAEALLAAMLGLLAAAIGVIAHRHLKAKVYGLEAEDAAAEPVQTLPRQARATA
ncbi:MotA/TolQ/ExbB proton channel family protein [Phenylobacterium sp. J367]|uniref:MotA/TolQ/ExbB proton channel family protein n=1 Tax=Phenylobacterium sp. J367 TaxID=2898435 RepID=UPI002150A69E|nr:MotA/TolQ/ExbB proton channel family protein [Phenylobacterium sp. J367]MCR5879800.1 MotA/TolQ/ExbB proton channel family protein [Phenylobacterium sp. J367]